MGNLCSKYEPEGAVELRYQASVSNPVQGDTKTSDGSAPKQHTAPAQSPNKDTPASTISRPTSGNRAPPPPSASPKAVKPPATSSPKVPVAQNSPASPNKKKLTELLKKEKSKNGNLQGQPAPGVEGWLFRLQESEGNSSWIKVWATLYEHRLDYYKERPSKEKDTVLGYITVKAESDCTPFEEESRSSFFSSTGQYCFKLSDATVEVTFSAPGESDQIMWVESIRAAIDGVRHTRPDTDATETASDRVVSKRASAAREGMQVIMELPRKMGELQKKPIVGRFGMKSPKTRWFKLEGGELRYYGESSMRPSSLKQTIVLTGCSINVEQSKGKNIVLDLTDGNALCMEAASKELANEWTKAVKDTIDFLNSKSAAGKTRRINVANEHSDIATEVPKQVVPKSIETTTVILEALNQHFLMNAIGDKTSVVNALQPRTSLPGDVIIWQGTPGDLFYVLESGLVEVVKDHKQVGQISEGRAFGELALINSTSRAATIRALTVCKLWTLDRKTFRNVLANKELQRRSEIVGLLRNVKMLECLSDVTLGTVADVMQRVEYPAGQRIIKQGEVGDAFYVIERGTVSVTQSSLTSSSTELVRLSIGAAFGELALLSNEPRKASVTAVDAVVCLKLDVSNFNCLLGNIEQVRNEDAGMAILRKVDLLSSLKKKQLNVISRSLTKQVYPKGTTIFSQGDAGEDFFMIASGAVAIQVNHVEVARLEAGSYFGETSLMSRDKRNATVIALGGGSVSSANNESDETVCLLLSRADFNRLLGPLEAILKAESDKRAQEASNRGMAGLAKSFGKSLKRLSGGDDAITVDARQAPIQLNDLIGIRILGTGTFGVVKLVLHRRTNNTYALKVMEKQTVCELHQEKGVFHERDLMKELDYPLLPALHATFNDADNLYMLLELLPGGEFWGILHEDPNILGYNRLGGISDDKAAFYSACVVAGLGHMHSMDICYRDMKPENMVLDAQGYIKIVDYGFCKKLPNNASTNTMCGTPEYIPPEMVRSKPHTRAVDLWSFGVFLFELATRGTPFEHNETSGIYRNIMKAQEILKTAFKPGFSNNMKSLILKLLTDNPAMRIGMLRNGFDDIWSQPLYLENGVTKEAIESKSIRPPFSPDVAEVHAEDANIEEEERVRYSGKVDFSTF